MLPLIVFIVCLIVLLGVTSFFKTRFKVVKSLVGAFFLTVMFQLLEQFYLSSILIITFILCWGISKITTFQAARLKLLLSVLFSVVVVTGILSITHFADVTDPSDPLVLRILFMYYPILLLFGTLYSYLLLSMFSLKLFESSNPITYIVQSFKGGLRLVQLLWITSKKGLPSVLKRDTIRTPYIIADIFEEMGGVFVKFAQVLSTRKDMLPKNYVDAFSNLQDQVKPMTEPELSSIMQDKMGNLDTVFSTFNMKPLAAASIGQVHRATLKSSREEVIVKILRPNIRSQIGIDLNLLIRFMTWLSEQSNKLNQMGLITLAEGFKNNLIEETDFENESLNTNVLKTAFSTRDIPIKIPTIYTEYSTRHVLVMEYIEGDSLSQENIAAFSEPLMHAFFDQLLIIGVFHADPHPGNILVTKDGEVALIDFGSVGFLSDKERFGLLNFFLGFKEKDESKMAKGLLDMCEENQTIRADIVEKQLQQLLLRASYSSNPTQVMMNQMVTLLAGMGMSLKPVIAGAFRAIVTLDGALTSADPYFSLTRASETYATHVDQIQLVDDQITQFKNQLQSYLPALSMFKGPTQPLNRQGETKIGHDVLLLFTTSIFTFICMTLILTSFFINHEVMQFLFIPLSYSGFFIGMLLLVITLIRQLNKKRYI